MYKVIIRNIQHTEDFSMSKLLMGYSKEGKILFLTEKPELAKELDNINKEKLVVICTTNINQSNISKLMLANPGVKNVIIHSGRIIDRYYNESLNVKRNKAKEYFDAWDTKVTILSKNEGMNAVMSNNDVFNGKTHQQIQNALYGPKTSRRKKK